jgi:hypothetical protein
MKTIVVPTLPPVDLMDDPMVLIPCEWDDWGVRRILDDLRTGAELGDDCVLSVLDLTGALTHYAYVLPLSLAQVAAWKMRGNLI